MAAAKPQLTRAALAAAAVAVVAACGEEARGPSHPPAERRVAMPADAERYVHRTFHRLPRSCARGRADRRRLDATTARFVELYRRYPADRFGMRIDDESGTMLSATLVLRKELARCSPRHAARIDPVLPPRLRRALRPLGADGGLNPSGLPQRSEPARSESTSASKSSPAGGGSARAGGPRRPVSVTATDTTASARAASGTR